MIHLNGGKKKVRRINEMEWKRQEGIVKVDNLSSFTSTKCFQELQCYTICIKSCWFEISYNYFGNNNTLRISFII